MNLLLQRDPPTANSTSGELSLDSDPRIYYTLEPPAGRAIPAGAYKVIIVPSPRFKRDMPRLLNVPGWPQDDVLLHWGNVPEETEGCILVGLTRAEDFVGSSRDAFAQLYARLEAPASAGDLTITVADAVASAGAQQREEVAG